eukprot:g1072.t1
MSGANWGGIDVHPQNSSGTSYQYCCPKLKRIKCDATGGPFWNPTYTCSADTYESCSAPSARPPDVEGYSTSPAAYTVGTAISANTPITDGGRVAQFVVKSGSTLPAGLTMNTLTGVITGTPTQATLSQQAVVIYAENAAGNHQKEFTLRITVNTNLASPVLATYASAPASYSVGTAISSNGPVVSGGDAASFSVSPTLPAGLSMSTTTGVITGTPVAHWGLTLCPWQLGTTGVNDQLACMDGTTCTGWDCCANHGNRAKCEPKRYQVMCEEDTCGDGRYSGSGNTQYCCRGSASECVEGERKCLPSNIETTTSHVITARNSAGSSTYTLSITVKIPPPQIVFYAASPLQVTVGTNVNNQPTMQGTQTQAAFSVSPTLPSGLSLSSSTGAVTGTPSQESSGVYTITIANGAGSDTYSLSIIVTQVAPQFRTPSYSSTSASYKVGTAVDAQALLDTTNGGPAANFDVVPTLPQGLNFDRSSGQISGTPQVIALASVVYTITATNTGGSVTTEITFNVVDAAPILNGYTASKTTYTLAVAIATNEPTLGAGSGTQTTFTTSPTLPAGLAIDASTGHITGTPTSITAAGNFVVTVTTSGGTASLSLEITVVDKPPVLDSYGVLAAAYTKGVDLASSATGIIQPTLGASSGTPTGYTGTAVPSGLSLDPVTGAISGVPQAIGTSTVTVTASNTGGANSVTLTIIVVDVKATISGYTTSSPVYTKGVDIATNSPTLSGGAPTQFEVSPALPAGLALNWATGQITGRSTVVAASATYVITCENSGGSSTFSMDITVNDKIPKFQTSAYAETTVVYPTGVAIPSNLPQMDTTAGGTGQIGGSPAVSATAAVHTVTAWTTGGSDDFQFELTVVDAVPTIQTLSDNSGVQVGSPGATLTLRVGGSSDATITVLVVDAAPILNGYTASKTTYTLAVAIATNEPTLGAGSGTQTTFTTSPTLPAGLAIDASTGHITGTPTSITAAGNFVVTVTTSGGTASLSLEITVVDKPPVLDSYGVLAAAYTKGVDLASSATGIIQPTLGASSGTPTGYTGTAVPSGLSLDPVTGAISGVPQAIGTSTVTVTASNTGGANSVTLTIIVVDVKATISGYTTSSPMYTKDLAIPSNAPTMTGGKATWPNVSGGGAVANFTVRPALPAGLAWDSSTGVIEGTPTAAAAKTVYTITAYNQMGDSSFGLDITVRDIPPRLLGYAVSSMNLTMGNIVSTNLPTIEGGAATQFEINPRALPSAAGNNGASGAGAAGVVQWARKVGMRAGNTTTDVVSIVTDIIVFYLPTLEEAAIRNDSTLQRWDTPAAGKSPDCIVAPEKPTFSVRANYTEQTNATIDCVGWVPWEWETDPHCEPGELVTVPATESSGRNKTMVKCTCRMPETNAPEDMADFAALGYTVDRVSEVFNRPLDFAELNYTPTVLAGCLLFPYLSVIMYVMIRGAVSWRKGGDALAKRARSRGPAASSFASANASDGNGVGGNNGGWAVEAVADDTQSFNFGVEMTTPRNSATQPQKGRSSRGSSLTSPCTTGGGGGGGGATATATARARTPAGEPSSEKSRGSGNSTVPHHSRLQPSESSAVRSTSLNRGMAYIFGVNRRFQSHGSSAAIDDDGLAQEVGDRSSFDSVSAFGVGAGAGAGATAASTHHSSSVMSTSSKGRRSGSGEDKLARAKQLPADGIVCSLASMGMLWRRMKQHHTLLAVFFGIRSTARDGPAYVTLLLAELSAIGVSTTFLFYAQFCHSISTVFEPDGLADFNWWTNRLLVAVLSTVFTWPPNILARYVFAKREQAVTRGVRGAACCCGSTRVRATCASAIAWTEATVHIVFCSVFIWFTCTFGFLDSDGQGHVPHVTLPPEASECSCRVESSALLVSEWILNVLITMGFWAVVSRPGAIVLFYVVTAKKGRGGRGRRQQRTQLEDEQPTTAIVYSGQSGGVGDVGGKLEQLQVPRTAAGAAPISNPLFQRRSTGRPPPAADSLKVVASAMPTTMIKTDAEDSKMDDDSQPQQLQSMDQMEEALPEAGAGANLQQAAHDQHQSAAPPSAASTAAVVVSFDAAAMDLPAPVAPTAAETC